MASPGLVLLANGQLVYDVSGGGVGGYAQPVYTVGGGSVTIGGSLPAGGNVIGGVTLSPSWSEPTQVLAPTLVGTGGVSARASINVQNKRGGYLFCRAMPTTSATPSAGINLVIRRILNGTPAGGAGTVDIGHPNGIILNAGTTANVATTLSATPSIPTNVVTLTSGTSFAAGQFVGLVNSVSSPTAIDWARVSKIASTTLTLDRNLTNSAIASGWVISNNAFIPSPIWIDGTPGTDEWEVIWDNGAETTVAYVVEVWAQIQN
jgi:hypothetical protein